MGPVNGGTGNKRKNGGTIMLEMMNMTNTEGDLSRFSGAEALEAYLKREGLNGVEMMPYGKVDAGYIPEKTIAGVHLGYFPCWVDFWNGDEAALIREYGSLEGARERFGGDTRETLVDFYRRQLEFARDVGARYVVFHVSDVSLEETLSYRFTHTDHQVVGAALELIDKALGTQEWGFEFLAENLWWPGLTLTRADIAREVIEGIPAKRKGFMLDTGHMAHTCLDLETEEETVEYILRQVDALGEAGGYIRGMHLQCGLTGGFVKEMLKKRPRAEGSTYFERLGNAYEYVLGIDPHEPFTSPEAGRLVERVRPEYLTHELITWDLEEYTRKLRRQRAAIGRGKA